MKYGGRKGKFGLKIGIDKHRVGARSIRFFRSVIRKFAPRSGYFPRAGQSHPLPPSLGKETRWRWTSSPPLRLLLFRGAQGGILSAVAVTRAERSSWNLTQMLFFLPSLPRFHFNEIPCPDGIVSRLFFSFPFFSLSLSFPLLHCSRHS